MGRIPLEAAAAARPSLAFATGGLPDVVREGVSGLLIPTGDWGQLAEALGRLAEDPLPEVGRTARGWVEASRYGIA